VFENNCVVRRVRECWICKRHPVPPGPETQGGECVNQIGTCLSGGDEQEFSEHGIIP